MTEFEIEKAKEIIGEEKLLEMCALFPNKRLPGKKFCFKILREKFRAEFQGSDLKGFTAKYGVSIQTLYNWLH